jgi:hypothetical protein
MPVFHFVYDHLGFIFSAALSRVLRAMGFCEISFWPGRTTFFVSERITLFLPQAHSGNFGGQMHPFSMALICCLTIRSSSE